MNQPRTGVLLMQMGGPRNLDEVQSYICNLFQDPYLVQLPAPISWFRKPLAHWVAKRRAPVVKAQYQKIGGSSPNNAITIEQASLLQTALQGHGDIRCYAAMAYTPPTVGEALRQSIADGCERWIALPMFPQYSTASTKAIFADLDQCMKEQGADLRQVTRIMRWGSRPDYLDAVTAMTMETLEAARKVSAQAPHLVISAHGLPVSYVNAGDPYVDEIEDCVAGLRARLPQDQDSTLAYQSRATPRPWVKPSTIETLQKLGSEGIKNIVVLPISFVNDHIETLFEIDQELRDEALESGVEHYARVPVFNTDAALIAILKSIVVESLPK
ncbi:MAG: ferrochelatase [Arenicella sp.]|nr:ferrochelatase [Arenicella sp.]